MRRFTFMWLVVLAVFAAGAAHAHGRDGHAHHRAPAAPSATADAAAPAAAAIIARDAVSPAPSLSAAAAFVAFAGSGAPDADCAGHETRCCAEQCCMAMVAALPVPAGPRAIMSAAVVPAPIDQPPDAPLRAQLRPPSL